VKRKRTSNATSAVIASRFCAPFIECECACVCVCVCLRVRFKFEVPVLGQELCVNSTAVRYCTINIKRLFTLILHSRSHCYHHRRFHRVR
jgi:hypothetical protein